MVRNGIVAMGNLVSAEVVRNSHDRSVLSEPAVMPGLSNNTLGLETLVAILYYRY